MFLDVYIFIKAIFSEVISPLLTNILPHKKKLINPADRANPRDPWDPTGAALDCGSQPQTQAPALGSLGIVTKVSQ